jgi:hypothetical protein
VVESASDDRVPLTDVYLEVKNADGAVGLGRTQLSTMESIEWNGGTIEFSTSFTQYGVTFMNDQNESSDHLDPGDGFILNFTVLYVRIRNLRFGSIWENLMLIYRPECCIVTCRRDMS